MADVTGTLPMFHSIGGLCAARLAMTSAHTSPQKAGYFHHQRSVLYTSLQPDVHKDFSHVPLFTEWLTVPKLLGPLQPLTGPRTACRVKVTSPKTAWAKLLRWGLTDSCSRGWISHNSYLDSSLQMKVQPAETSAGRSAEEMPILSLLEGRHCLVKHGQVFSGISSSNVRSYCYF